MCSLIGHLWTEFREGKPGERDIFARPKQRCSRCHEVRDMVFDSPLIGPYGQRPKS